MQKPEYSMASWCAMSICSGIGTGLLFWAMGEPISPYDNSGRYGEAGTHTAGIFAVAQARDIELGFVQYCMYAICGATFAIICYNRKSLSFNSIVECATGNESNG